MGFLDLFTRKRKGFAPNIFSIGNNLPSLFSLSNNAEYMAGYLKTPELRSIIDNRAACLSNGIWKHYRNGEELENSEIVKLLNQPNAVQAGREFLKEFSTYYDVFGNSYVYKFAPVGFKTQALFNLPSQFIEPVATKENFLTQTKIEDIVQCYLLRNNGDHIFDTVSIIHKAETNIEFDNNEFLKGKSKLHNLVYPVSNIIAAYEASNVLLKKKGAIGIFSSDLTNDNAIPTSDKEQERLQEKMQSEYGLTSDKWQFIFTQSSLKWTPVTMNATDLQLWETIKSSVRAISDMYAFPYELLGNEKGVTFSNLLEAKKRLYTDGIIPYADEIASEFTRGLLLPDNEYLKLDYSHIHVLQDNAKEMADINKIASEYVINLNKAVSLGEMDRESAILLLENFGYPGDEAVKLVTSRSSNTSE